MESSSSVCVVGAGVVGLSVALNLALEQLRNHPQNAIEIGTFL